MSKSLITISHRPDDLAFTAQVAIAAGLTLRHPTDLAAAMRMIDEEDQPVVFVDASSAEEYQKFEAAVQEAFGIFSAKIGANRLHYLSSGDIYEVPYLIGSPIFGSYIRRNYATPGVGEHYGLLVRASLEERAFGIQRLTKPGT